MNWCKSSIAPIPRINIVVIPVSFHVIKTPLNRSRTSVLRQNRAMNINATELGHIQNFLGKNLSVGNDDKDICPNLLQLGLGTFFTRGAKREVMRQATVLPVKALFDCRDPASGWVTTANTSNAVLASVPDWVPRTEECQRIRLSLR